MYIPLEHRTRLPAPDKPSRSVGSALNQRISVRSFSALPVPKRSLATLLYNAHSTDRNDWAKLDRQGLTVQSLIIAQSVEGLTPGIYEYDSASQTLIYKKLPLSKGDIRELLIQEDFTEAPLLIWLFCDLARACTVSGSIGHKQMMVRAGAMAYSLWMGALACGLQGTMVAGLVPGAARALLDLDGYRRSSLIAFVCGVDDGKPTTYD